MKRDQIKAMKAKVSYKTINVLDTAYKSDFVSPHGHGFTDSYLKKLQNDGLLTPSNVKPENYWITQKGLDIYKQTDKYKTLMQRHYT